MKPQFLSVLIPVYNERKTLGQVVRRVAAMPMVLEIILVDDGSTDGTRSVIREEILPRFPQARLLCHEVNRGKGAAIRTALEAARGEAVIVQDADLEYSPENYTDLVRPMVEQGARVVYGSRFRHVNKRLFIWHWFLNRFCGRHYEIRYLHHFLGILVLNTLANVLYGAKTSDEATCYKVFRADVIKSLPLKCTGFEFCPEVTAKVSKRGIPIVEVPVTYHPRSRAEGKKLKWTHGFEAIWTLIKYRFVD